MSIMEQNVNALNDRSLAFRLGAWSSMLLMAYTIATITIVVMIGGPPLTVTACFEMLKQNRMHGFLRLDVLTVFIMPLYYILFYSLFISLQKVSKTMSELSAILIFAGVTIFLAAPSVFSYVRLNDLYWSAGSDSERMQFMAAAESILAADIWNGTGARISGLMVQSGAVILSVLMLQSVEFSKFTAITGVLTHGLDLLHIIIAFFLPSLANSIMALAGTLYLVWFPLIAISLFRLASVRANDNRQLHER